jgi:hypothetical protein
MKESAKREDRVNFRSTWRPAGMSRHNRQRSVEEGRSLLGGTHAMKSVKPSENILEVFSTGFNMDVHASFDSQMVHRPQSPSFMLFNIYAVFLRPTP